MALQSGAARIVALAEKTGLMIEKICGALCVFCFAAMTLVAILGVFSLRIFQQL